MVRRDGVAVRTERIREITKLILSLLHKYNGIINYSKTFLMLQYEIGLTKDRLVEYLQIAAGTDHFVIDKEKDEIRSVTFETDSG